MMSLRKIASVKTFLCLSTLTQRCISTSPIVQSFIKNEKYNKIGFIGSGNMACAIIAGLISKQKYQADEIYVTDSDREYVEYLKHYKPLFKENNIQFADSVPALLKETNTIMLCVKPQDLKKVLAKNANDFNSNHLVLSIAAGTQLVEIEKLMENKSRVIRIMTNTAALIQQSCSVYSKGIYATDEDASYVKNLLESIGSCEGEIKEDMMDVVTALAGSGPAYFFLILDALADGAVKMGLPRNLAIRLATQTMIGSSKMVKAEIEQNGKTVQELREAVCSPGGTTLAGLDALHKGKIEDGMSSCITEATKRALELNK